ncbi:MAG: outer membrane lipoprotein carrier protein LolA [Bdellovibrionales bacterium]
MKTGTKKTLLAVAVLKYLVIALLLFTTHSHAAPPAMPLSAQDSADLQRVAAYLNSVPRMESRIVQMNPDGSVVHGLLKIMRPGKLRLDYDPPINSQLVADGAFVHYWDAPMSETSSVPQGNSPASLILAAQVDFTRGMTITNIRRQDNTLEISLYKTDDPGNGILTLVFEDNPLLLKQWYVVDSQGATTKVTLQNVNFNPAFSGNTFIYSPPRRDKR